MRRVTHRSRPFWRYLRTLACGRVTSILPWSLILGLLLGLASASVAEEAAGDGEPESASYVGDDETCAMCHDEKAEQLKKTPHGWALTNTKLEPAKRGCEACHGPGQTHADEGGGKGIGNLQNFAAARPAAVRSAVCLKCHSRSEALHSFHSAAHVLSGIACTDCHRAHDFSADPLLRVPTPELCYGCHLNVRAKFALPEHHKVDEGVVGCSDCHEPHGTRNLFAMRAPNDQTCLRCHGEIEGPFVFEHDVLLTEGCVRCHDPHGSTNRHLLVRQQVAQLCYECHTVTPTNHLQPSFRDCTRCHVSIHGSNVDPRFLQQ